ncbi:MAG: ABC transporter permease subunit, partial [Solimonas sp.]
RRRAGRGLTLALRAAQALVVPALLLAAWHRASQRSDVDAYIFVSLHAIRDAFVELWSSGELWIGIRGSLLRTLSGLAIGASLGIATGSLMAVSRWAERLIGPLYHALRQVPLLGLVPLLSLWFGTGDTAKLVMVTLAAFYPTVLNTFDGMRQVSERQREVGAMLTLGRWQTFRLILLPASRPAIVTGLSHAIAFAWLASMGGELLLAAGAGLGSILLIGQNAGRMELVIVAVVLISLLGYLMNLGFGWLARRWLLGRGPVC